LIGNEPGSVLPAHPRAADVTVGPRRWGFALTAWLSALVAPVAAFVVWGAWIDQDAAVLQSRGVDLTDYGFFAFPFAVLGFLVMGFGAIAVAAGHSAGATRSAGRPARMGVAFVLTILLGFFVFSLSSVARGLTRGPISVSDPSIVLHLAAYATAAVPIAATWMTALRGSWRSRP
jgi:hypothetical protein